MNNFWKRNITSPIINFLGRKKVASKFMAGPILIGGCARSGTSLLLSILSAHPQVFAFPHEVDAHTSWKRKSGHLVPERIDRLYRYLLTHEIPRANDRWCEKRPYNVHYINEILKYYGATCRFIHIIRDPRAVCTSIHPEKREKYWVSIDRWINDVSAGLRFINHPQILTLKYEDLVNEPTEVIEKIMKFLELPFIKEMEEWDEHATVKSNRAWFHDLKNIHQQSLRKWAKPEHKKRVDQITHNRGVQDLMELLDYE